jgi:biotin carboxyl carrier protein
MSVIPLSREEIDLVRRHGLSFAQIKWRREKIRDLGQRFKQEYPENEVDCFLASARGVFDQVALRKAVARIAAQPAPAKVASLKRAAGDTPVAPAHLSVWAAPIAGRVYVIGADVGEGVAGGDASTACVIDRTSGAQVAELHGRIAPDRFAQQLNLLGRWYNRAMLAVERNNHGHSTLNTLRNVCRYPRLYYHVRYDAMRQASPMLGWPTDQATKPILVDDLAAAISQEALIMRSGGLVDECRTFVVHNDGSQGAEVGQHDDRVIAAGIAWQARKRMVARPIAKRPEGW